MIKKKQFPYSTVIELTLKCNMKCIHCGSSAGKNREKELTYEEWVKVFEELASLNGKLVTFMGGEPFLRKEWYELAKEVKKVGMNLIFMSNGYLINDDVISKIKTLDPHVVAISLDGGTAETHDEIRGLKGSFEKCKEVITKLRNEDLPTTIVSTIHKKNLKELPLIRDLVINRDIAWQIQIADPIGRFPKELHLSKKEFYSVALFIAHTRQKYSLKQMPITGAHCIGYNSQILPNLTLSPKWTGCQAGITALGIQSNGGVKGCLSLSNDFVQGNVRDKSIIEIWNNPNFSKYNRDFKKESLEENCINCKYGKSCKGGCLAVSTSTTGKMHNDPYCLYSIEKEMK